MQDSLPYFHFHHGAARKAFDSAEIVLEDRMIQINPTPAGKALNIHFPILLSTSIVRV
jgi:hypothetical protein